MCAYDIYLAGTMQAKWREEFKNSLTGSFKIFDPMVDNHNHLNDHELEEQVAKEFCVIHDCNVIVFYFSDDWNGSTALMEMGECIGAQKQVVVGIEEGCKSEESIRKYCEYRGVLVTSNIAELASTAQDCAAQVHACQMM